MDAETILGELTGRESALAVFGGNAESRTECFAATIAAVANTAVAGREPVV